MVVADDLDELVLLTHVEGNGTCTTVSDVYSFWSGAKIPHFNLGTNQWTFSNATPEMKFSAAEYDPVSKKVIVLGLDCLCIYDPVTKQKWTAIDFTKQYAVTDQAGNFISKDVLRYNNQLVYYPPNQKLYYFDRFAQAVYEVTLNRADFGKSKIQRIATTGQHSGHDEPGYAYDSVNQIIGGGVRDNIFYAFNPMTKSWTAKMIQGGTPGTQAYHAINYDPVNNVFVFLSVSGADRHTWAYRYIAK
jgi:hypothetical protein